MPAIVDQIQDQQDLTLPSVGQAIVRKPDVSGKPVFGGQDFPAGFSGAYADLSGKPTLGTAASLNAGTTGGQVLAANTAAAVRSVINAPDAGDVVSKSTTSTQTIISDLTLDNGVGQTVLSIGSSTRRGVLVLGDGASISKQAGGPTQLDLGTTFFNGDFIATGVAHKYGGSFYSYGGGPTYLDNDQAAQPVVVGSNTTTRGGQRVIDLARDTYVNGSLASTGPVTAPGATIAGLYVSRYDDSPFLGADNKLFLEAPHLVKIRSTYSDVRIQAATNLTLEAGGNVSVSNGLTIGGTLTVGQFLYAEDIRGPNGSISFNTNAVNFSCQEVAFNAPTIRFFQPAVMRGGLVNDIGPLIVGASSAAAGESGDIIVNAKPVVCRSTLGLASVDTDSVPGTAVGQVVHSTVSGTLAEWRGSGWTFYAIAGA